LGHMVSMVWRGDGVRARIQALLTVALVVMALVVASSPPRARGEALGAPGTPVATPMATPSPLFADVPAATLPAAEQALRELSIIEITATLDPIQSTVGGEMTVTWRNPVERPASEVWFRLFPNASYYGAGALTVRNVTVDGAQVTTELALDDTALRVPLPAPVAGGQSARIAMDFVATVPADSTGSYGIFTHDTQAGLWVLADWHPLLAVYEPAEGWILPPVTTFGDPTYAPSAFYDVTLTAPEGLLVAASGVTAETVTADGLTTRRTIAGPARDFVLVAAEQAVPRRENVDGTQVTLWTAPDLDPAIAERTLAIAADVLRNYQARWGPYPARELELVQVNPSGALGIAWSGLLFLDGPTLLEGYGERNNDGLAAVIAQLGLLRSDAPLRRLIVTRALLLSTALAPPFYIALSGDHQASGLGTLGTFMVASAAASLASTYIWGRLADRSSRRVLMFAAALASVANAVAAFTALVMPDRLAAGWFLPAMLFVLMIAHQGVRLGRSVHIVDMADVDNRATYTALSNSVVGVILLAGGVFGLIAQWLGIGVVLGIFTLMAALAIVMASRLDEVQSAPPG
ncbi:MAG: MFS transporter, partial [Thermomicrobiales bacterium]|nr:MFS transporter [Thermomicrobiales bacterium]